MEDQCFSYQKNYFKHPNSFTRSQTIQDFGEITTSASSMQQTQKSLSTNSLMVFYHPSFGKNPDISNPFESGMNNAIKELNRMDSIHVTKRSPIKAARISPSELDFYTRRDIKKSNLLHPISFLNIFDKEVNKEVNTSPKKKSKSISPMKRSNRQTAKCVFCNSTNIQMIPHCKYCGNLQYLSDKQTTIKRYGYQIIQESPHISHYELLDKLMQYMMNNSELDSKRNILTSKEEETIETKSKKLETPGAPVFPLASYNLPAKIQEEIDISKVKEEEEADQNTTSIELKQIEKTTSTGLEEMERESKSSHVWTSTMIKELALYDVMYEIKEAISSNKEISDMLKQNLLMILSTLIFKQRSELDEGSRIDLQDILLEIFKHMPTEDAKEVISDYIAYCSVENALSEKYMSCGGKDIKQLKRQNSSFRENNSENCNKTTGSKSKKNIKRTGSIRHVDDATRREIIVNKLEQKTEENTFKDEKVFSKEAKLAEKQKIFMGSERFIRCQYNNSEFIIDENKILTTMNPIFRDIILSFNSKLREACYIGNDDDRQTILNLNDHERQVYGLNLLEKYQKDREFLIAGIASHNRLFKNKEHEIFLSLKENVRKEEAEMWIQERNTPTINVDTTVLVSERLNSQCPAPIAFEFNIPDSWDRLLKKKHFNQMNPMGIQSLYPLILQIYTTRSMDEETSNNFPQFVLKFLHMQYGLQNVVRTKLNSLLSGLEMYCHQDVWVLNFTRFCGILDPSPPEALNFILSVLQSLKFAELKKSDINTYHIPRDCIQPIKYEFAVSAIEHMCRDFIIDPKGYLGELKGKKYVTLPKKPESNLIQLEIVDSIDLLIMIQKMWESDRLKKEIGLRTLFERFDIDNRNSLDRLEFEEFVKTCEKNARHKQPTDYLLKKKSQNGESKNPSIQYMVKSLTKEQIRNLFFECTADSIMNVVTVESFIKGALKYPLFLSAIGIVPSLKETQLKKNMAKGVIATFLIAYQWRKKKNNK